MFNGCMITLYGSLFLDGAFVIPESHPEDFIMLCGYLFDVNHPSEIKLDVFLRSISIFEGLEEQV